MSSPLIDAILGRLGIGADRLAVLASRDERVVVRVACLDGDLMAKAASAAGAFDQEARAMRILASIGIPVSRVVTVESGPPALLVATWAEGEPVTADSSPGSLRQVGSILRRIHSLPASAPWSGQPTIDAWIGNWLGIVTRWWEETGFAEPTNVAQARAWLADVRPLLAEANGSQMLFDGRPDHFLVGMDGCIRLIDVADLQSGDPAMDLAVLELDAPGLLPPVLDGYVPNRAERARFDRIVPFYVFLRALAAAEWQDRVLHNAEESRRYLDIAGKSLMSYRGTLG